MENKDLNNMEDTNNKELEPIEGEFKEVEERSFVLVDEEDKKTAAQQQTTVEDDDKEKEEEPVIEPNIHVQTKQTKKTWNQKVSYGLLGGCLLLSCVGGFGGTAIANSLSKSNGSSPSVIYQSVERKDQDGNDVTSMSVKDVASNVSDSVVEIQTEQVQFGSTYSQYVGSGAGSGVILSEDGYIVTNNHVIDNANRVVVRTKDGTEYEATLVGKDAKTDLAVLKIEATGLKAAVLGDSSTLSVGDSAVVIGNPLGELGGTVTNGIISALDREITIDGESMHLLQTNAAINPGNSGGGMFNDAGELIGIINAKSTGTDVEGLGFAIPINIAKDVIADLINNGYVTNRPVIGVSLKDVSDELSAFQLGVNSTGVYVASVTEGGPAEKAGMMVRDRIVKVDGQDVSSSSDVKSIINEHSVGDTLEFTVVRNNKEVNLSLVLEENVPSVSDTIKS